MATGVRPPALTARDHAIIRAAWSFGQAPARVLHALISPGTAPGTFRDRLRRLHRAGYLEQHRYVAPTGDLWLYGIGRAALLPGDAAPWRPGAAQLAHTVAVAETVAAIHRPGFAAPLRVTGWQGEAELRAWAGPGAPLPDARIAWAAPAAGAWLVELDRATESRTAWRRKLVRYLAAGTTEPVLAITTSRQRAANIAALAADVGVPLLATTSNEVNEHPDPEVFDARSRHHRPLSRCT